MENEDTAGHLGSCAWVIDGATDVFSDRKSGNAISVSRYVKLLQTFIEHHCREERSLEEILRSAVKELYQQLLQEDESIAKAPEYQLPTFAVAMIRILNHSMEYYVLGDCVISYLAGGKISWIRDERISAFSKYNREQMKKNSLDPRNNSSAREIYRNTRRKANAPDGYYIGSMRGSGLQMGLSGSLPLDPGDRVILFSDGFLDYLNDNPEKIRCFFAADSLRREISLVKEYLENDQIYLKELRPKQIDDRSILLLEA